MRDIGLLFTRVQGKLDTMSSYIRLQMGSALEKYCGL